MSDPVARLRPPLEAAAATAAMVGGVALTGCAVFTVGAVLTDAAGVPILGDSEVVELVVGACVFAFLPYCQMRDGHVAITLFTDRAPRAVRGGLEVFAAVLTLVVAAVLTWRLIVGGVDVWEKGRASMFLQLPLWWGYAAGAGFACLWTATAAFGLADRVVRRAAADA